jgi:hypothetical protein
MLLLSFLVVSLLIGEAVVETELASAIFVPHLVPLNPDAHLLFKYNHILSYLILLFL